MKKVLIFILSLMIIMVPAYVYAVDEPGAGEDPTTPTTPEPSPTPSPSPEPEVVDNTLSSITVTGGTLTPGFNKTTYEYTITDIKPETFSISFVQSSPNKTLAVENPNGLKLDDIAKRADKTATITVTYTDSENKQHTNPYKIRVDYEIPKKVTYLKSLSVTGYEFDRKFNKDTAAYEFEIPNEVDTITINAVAEDETATITYDGNQSNVIKNLKVGENNHIPIVVKNGNDSRTYYLNVTRAVAAESKQEETDENELEVDDATDDNKDDNDKEKTKFEKEIEERVAETPNINPILNRITVTIAALVGIALGGFGIYIYVKTSPKSMKKDIIKHKNNKSNNDVTESSMVEVKKKKKMEIKDDLVETKEFKVNDTNKDA